MRLLRRKRLQERAQIGRFEPLFLPRNEQFQSLTENFLPTPATSAERRLDDLATSPQASGRPDHAPPLSRNFFILPCLSLKGNSLFYFLSKKMDARPGKFEAGRDDFLVELLALVQKYWPGAEGPQGQH